jgi:hypothetical protein
MDKPVLARGRQISMTDDTDAKLNAIAAHESMLRRKPVSRASIIAEWIDAYPLPDWVPPSQQAEAATPAELAA